MTLFVWYDMVWSTRTHVTSPRWDNMEMPPCLPVIIVFHHQLNTHQARVCHAKPGEHLSSRCAPQPPSPALICIFPVEHLDLSRQPDLHRPRPTYQPTNLHITKQPDNNSQCLVSDTKYHIYNRYWIPTGYLSTITGGQLYKLFYYYNSLYL